MDDDMANLIVAQLLYLDSANPNQDITLYINSPGGSVTAGAAATCVACGCWGNGRFAVLAGVGSVRTGAQCTGAQCTAARRWVERTPYVGSQFSRNV